MSYGYVLAVSDIADQSLHWVDDNGHLGCDRSLSNHAVLTGFERTAQVPLDNRTVLVVALPGPGVGAPPVVAY